jgi:hypothetical protein
MQIFTRVSANGSEITKVDVNRFRSDFAGAALWAKKGVWESQESTSEK